MFFDQSILRRNGRFGFIWLAATQSDRKVLTKREICAVNIRNACSDIIEHIPGLRTTGPRGKEFSLYLSSQLMYGTVKIYQRHWDFLYADTWALFRKCFPEVHDTNEIDLVTLRNEPPTLECLLPTSLKDKNYDIFFGTTKIPDFELILREEKRWARSLEREIHFESSIPNNVTGDVSSPYSVSDPKQIQIPDPEVRPLNQTLPGEQQELPQLDQDNLNFIAQGDRDVSMVSSDAVSDVSRILQEVAETATETRNESRLPAFEATPAVHPENELPRTPKKTKKPQDGSPRKRRKRDNKKESSSQERSSQSDNSLVQDPSIAAPVPDQNGREQSAQITNREAPATNTGQVEVAAAEAEAPPQAQDARSQPRRQWAQDLPIQLRQLADSPSSSPSRRRRPAMLIVDENMQINIKEQSRDWETKTLAERNLQKNILPVIQEKKYMSEPGSRAFQNPKLRRLWKRHCQYGLKVDETDSEADSILQTSLNNEVSLEHSRRDRDSTSTNKGRASTSFVKDNSSLNESNASSNRDVQDTSMIQHGPDMIQHQPDMLQHQLSDLLPSGVMPVIQEEQIPEVQAQPANPLPPPLDHSLQGQDTARKLSFDDQVLSPTEQTSSYSDIVSVVRRNMRNASDWTTFKDICPTASTSRVQAASMFMELCDALKNQKLCARQDGAYADIFVWIPEA